jgi:hypothetical protein
MGKGVEGQFCKSVASLLFVFKAGQKVQEKVHEPPLSTVIIWHIKKVVVLNPQLETCFVLKLHG